MLHTVGRESDAPPPDYWDQQEDTGGHDHEV